MTTEERLDLLERRVVLQRRGLFLSWALLGLLAALPAAADKEPPPVTRFDQIVANGITVVSPEGKDVVRIASLAPAGGGAVATFTPAGKALVSLDSGNNGEGTVTTFTPAGKALVKLASLSNATGLVTTFGPAARLVTLGASDDGHGIVTTFSPAGKELVTLGSLTDGVGTVATFNPAGKELVRLGSMDNSGGGSVATFNPAGKKLVQLGSTVDGRHGTAIIYGPAGKEMVALGALDDGGFMSIFDKSGTPLLSTVTLSTTGEGSLIALNRAGKVRAAWP